MVVKRAGLVRERRQGTRRLYRARREALAEAKLLLDGIWDGRLARLRRAAGEARAAEPGQTTERFSVERDLLVASRPGVVWEPLTNARLATRWMGVGAAFDVEPGGGYRVEVVPGQVAAGAFVEIAPPRRLAHTWGGRGTPGRPCRRDPRSSVTTSCRSRRAPCCA